MAFKTLSESIRKKMSKIKMLVLDVDGVMTDGRIWWVEGTGWTRAYSVKDGYGIKLLQQAGIEVGIISGGDSNSVRERAKWLKINHVYLGDADKVVALEKIKAATGLKNEQIAFVGDDLFDIPVMKVSGFCATVPHAVDEVKEIADYITKERGGEGAVREICDLIRAAAKPPLSNDEMIKAAQNRSQ